MGWELIIDSYAKKQLKRISKKDAERIVVAIKDFTANPYAGDIEKMEDQKDVWRRRIGAYRIFYEVYTTRKIIYVFDIKRRTSSTY
ncbi:MAG: type II toxin-antitoxin system RelE/ParE family toxin [bacterium]|nr:type II toxin-antitoxin system RelE/ParE family toxin [bacterium]